MRYPGTLAIGLGCVVVTALAQTAAPMPDKGAMERALQQADGPRRRILEASRAKTGVKPEAAASAPAAAPVPAATQARAPAPAPAPAPATPITVIVTMPAAVQPVVVPGSGRVEEVPAVGVPEKLASPAALVELPPLATEGAAAAPSAATPTAARLAAPRLLSKVDPELPPRLLRRGLLRTEVLVDLTINPDGSVRDVAVRPTNNAELDAAVAEAVRQWRYEEQPAARTHQVVVVLTPS